MLGIDSTSKKSSRKPKKPIRRGMENRMGIPEPQDTGRKREPGQCPTRPEGERDAGAPEATPGIRQDPDPDFFLLPESKGSGPEPTEQIEAQGG